MLNHAMHVGAWLYLESHAADKRLRVGLSRHWLQRDADSLGHGTSEGGL